MSQIRGFGLIVCLLMVLMAYLKQAIPRGKTTYLMKAIISVFILVSILRGMMSLDFEAIKKALASEYTYETGDWDKTTELICEGLKREFQNYLNENEIQAKVDRVEVAGDYEGFSITKVILSGVEGQNAKNLLAGRYQIGLLYFEVKNE